MSVAVGVSVWSTIPKRCSASVITSAAVVMRQSTRACGGVGSWQCDAVVRCHVLTDGGTCRVANQSGMDKNLEHVAVEKIAIRQHNVIAADDELRSDIRRNSISGNRGHGHRDA